jgi:hypothetical protein
MKTLISLYSFQWVIRLQVQTFEANLDWHTEDVFQFLVFAHDGILFRNESVFSVNFHSSSMSIHHDGDCSS